MDIKETIIKRFPHKTLEKFVSIARSEKPVSTYHYAFFTDGSYSKYVTWDNDTRIGSAWKSGRWKNSKTGKFTDYIIEAAFEGRM